MISMTPLCDLLLNLLSGSSSLSIQSLSLLSKCQKSFQSASLHLFPNTSTMISSSNVFIPDSTHLHHFKWEPLHLRLCSLQICKTTTTLWRFSFVSHNEWTISLLSWQQGNSLSPGWTLNIRANNRWKVCKVNKYHSLFLRVKRVYSVMASPWLNLSCIKMIDSKTKSGFECNSL